MYIGFLLGEQPNYSSCCRLADVMGISHDSATRFLQRESYEGKDLYTESAPFLNLKGGALSVDDNVLDKPYSQYLAFVGYFWSGKHHRTVKGINLITLYYTDVDGQHLPVTTASTTRRRARPKTIISYCHFTVSQAVSQNG
jgi:hypothetical protein